MVIAVVMEIDTTVLSYAVGGEVGEKRGDKENIIDEMLERREKQMGKSIAPSFSLKSQADKSGNYWDKTECVVKTLWFSVENQDKYLIYLILDEFETLEWRCLLLRWIQE